MIFSVQAIKISLIKRTPGNDQVAPINLWNLRRYTWDSQEKFPYAISTDNYLRNKCMIYYE